MLFLFTVIDIWEVGAVDRRYSRAQVQAKSAPLTHIPTCNNLKFSSKLIRSISNYTSEIQFCSLMIQIKQYKFKLCDSNSDF